VKVNGWLAAFSGRPFVDELLGFRAELEISYQNRAPVLKKLLSKGKADTYCSMSIVHFVCRQCEDMAYQSLRQLQWHSCP
jgi:hypothetical protein